jgi:uncharacterized RDD family membrane protein YckC
MDRYHTFRARFFAGLIDGLVFIPLNIIDPYLSDPARGPSILIIWALISYTSYWLYSVLLHARYGQTLGKKVLKIRVLDLSEERIPTLQQAFLRDIGYIVLNCSSLVYFIYLVVAGRYHTGSELSTLPGIIMGAAGLVWFLLEITSMFTNEKRRALHDYIAKTVVVQEA